MPHLGNCYKLFAIFVIFLYFFCQIQDIVITSAARFCLLSCLMQCIRAENNRAALYLDMNCHGAVQMSVLVYKGEDEIRITVIWSGLFVGQSHHSGCLLDWNLGGSIIGGALCSTTLHCLILRTVLYCSQYVMIWSYLFVGLCFTLFLASDWSRSCLLFRVVVQYPRIIPLGLTHQMR